MFYCDSEFLFWIFDDLTDDDSFLFSVWNIVLDYLSWVKICLEIDAEDIEETRDLLSS